MLAWMAAEVICQHHHTANSQPSFWQIRSTYHFCHRKTVHFAIASGWFCHNSAIADTTDGKRTGDQTGKCSQGGSGWGLVLESGLGSTIWSVPSYLHYGRVEAEDYGGMLWRQRLTAEIQATDKTHQIDKVSVHPLVTSQMKDRHGSQWC